jgi:hypothetical protein
MENQMDLRKKKVIRLGSFFSFFFVLTSSLAFAEPITFDFRFDQAGGGASAVGRITFERSLLPNPGVAGFILPDPAVLALSVTVSGASSGNGTFSMESFEKVVWDTYGATLDLSRELVGQPTPEDPWGTDSCHGGDFNLVRISGSDAPTGVYCFALCSGEGASSDCMVLTSMVARSVQPVPSLNTWGLLFLALVLAAFVFSRYRRRIA